MQSILGLILELNPIHLGHKYFINKAKEISNSKYTIASLSSNFSMRGDIMIIDKFTRTKMALDLGIDLVLELPFVSCVASADYFAYNSINNLIKAGVNVIAFGVELDNIDKLNAIIEIIQSDDYNILLKKNLDSGLSYSTSSYRALSSLTTDQEIIDNFPLPNNTLAIQYILAIKKIAPNTKILLIKRINNNYFDLQPNNIMSSSSSLRNLLKENKDINEYLPEFSFNYLMINYNIVHEELFKLLKYQFTINDLSFFTNILGVKEGIESRILNMLSISNNYEEFINNVKTKRYSENRIKRLILHIINQTKDFTNQQITYFRVLGFNEQGKKYISKFPKELKKEIITSLKNPNSKDAKLVESELKSSKIYGLIINDKNYYKQEYLVPIQIKGENNDN